MTMNEFNAGKLIGIKIYQKQKNLKWPEYYALHCGQLSLWLMTNLGLICLQILAVIVLQTLNLKELVQNFRNLRNNLYKVTIKIWWFLIKVVWKQTFTKKHSVKIRLIRWNYAMVNKWVIPRTELLSRGIQE